MKAFVDNITSAPFLRFAIIGLISSGVYAVVVYLVLFFQMWGAATASAIGYLVALPTNYVGHRFFTFQSKGPTISEVPKFIFVHCINIFLSSYALYLSIDIFNFGRIFGIFLVLFFLPVSTYFLMRLFVFQQVGQENKTFSDN